MKIKTYQKASISLVIMLIGFIATIFFNNNSIIFLLQSGFEAGLVGGLADWFAVTALFRHPLGVPIPHTALLPKNRERITMALVSIVKDDLLSKASVIQRVEKVNFSQKVLGICRKGIYTEQFRVGLLSIIERVKNSVEVEEISIHINKYISDYLSKVDTKNVVEELVEEGLSHDYQDKLVDILIEKVREAVNREEVRREIAATSVNAVKKVQKKGMLQFTLNTVVGIVGEDKIGSTIQEFILLILKELEDIKNPTRVMLIQSINDNVRQLTDDDSFIEKIDNYKMELSSSDRFKEISLSILKDAEDKILYYFNDEVSMKENILPFIDNLLINISEDKDLIDKLEKNIRSQISTYIHTNHEKIGLLVKENIEKLDTETLIDLIEDKVGSDLQWIRINGAICGFLIGLVLGGIKLLVI
ncbi:DUF445 domain-containing protein [Clostridium manihotivorum]|uniref:DUF445 domain-containing protein n=1 Tax=Clostridium manihotivorum TaxID=2320868 RepID=A0A410DXW2_9CLOT|nr:DUF445 domain-containing protein [Clostridium manihotivorum]QAA34026.1 DUF445 domain-containing protein [Clostridium manihotivorum]